MPLLVDVRDPRFSLADDDVLSAVQRLRDALVLGRAGIRLRVVVVVRRVFPVLLVRIGNCRVLRREYF